MKYEEARGGSSPGTSAPLSVRESSPHPPGWLHIEVFKRQALQLSPAPAG